MFMTEELIPPVHPTDKSEIAILKTVSTRLKEGRGLCGHTIGCAAQLLGVPTTDLAAWEGGNSVYAIPLSTIKKAALVYDVSLDWLFGITPDDWETCPEVRKERDFSSHLQSLFIEEQAKVVTKLVEQNDQMNTLSNTVTALCPLIKDVYDAILRFWEINNEFVDMPGGSLVINRLDKADKAAHEAVCQMVRYKLLPFETLHTYSIKKAEQK